MNILITGGCGYIGSALLRTLGADHELTVLDNLATQRFPSLFADNLPKNGIRFIEGDICTYDLRSLFRNHNLVIHLAAITDAAGTANDGARVFWANLHGTERVSDACDDLKIPLVFPSTTSVYGKSNGLVDEASELRPQSPYAESKLRAERYLASLSDLKYVILRFGTIYGVSTGIRFHTFVQKACWLVATGGPVEIWRTALNQLRPYLYLKDAVRAIQHVIDNDLFPRDVFNVLSGNHTPAQVVDVIRKYRPELTIKTVDNSIMNQLSYRVDDSKFRATGWQSIGNLEDGIRETMSLLSGMRA